MLKFKRRDCTDAYDVVLDKNYTVGEFIITVLEERPSEWGYIYFLGVKCEYKWGKIITPMPEDLLGQTVELAKSEGGWSRMDYYLK